MAKQRRDMVQVTTAGSPIRIQQNITPISVIMRNSSHPILSGGDFVKSEIADVWWVPANSTEKHFVTACRPCTSIDACANIKAVAQSYIQARCRPVRCCAVHVDRYVYFPCRR